MPQEGNGRRKASRRPGTDREIHGRSLCPISSAFDVVVDKWTILIIRDLMIHGTHTYSEFLESPEMISTNIFADRLSLLTSP
ncbi:MAG: winged helix-turn-helix transcriptional regulator [Synechococcaceae cyanobacterium]